MASFDAQASRTCIAASLAAPTPCSQSGHLRRLELAQCTYHLAATMKSGGDEVALGHPQRARRHPERLDSRRCQAFHAGRHRLRCYVKMNFPSVHAVLPRSTLPHSHARTMRRHACQCLSAASMLIAVFHRPSGRLCMCSSSCASGVRKVEEGNGSHQ